MRFHLYITGKSNQPILTLTLVMRICQSLSARATSEALRTIMRGQTHRRLISTVITTPSIEVSFPITISTEPTYQGLMETDANPTTNDICPFCECVIKYPSELVSQFLPADSIHHWGACSPDCNPFGGLLE